MKLNVCVSLFSLCFSGISGVALGGLPWIRTHASLQDFELGIGPFNATNELTIAENVARLLHRLSRHPRIEYNQASLLNVQIRVTRAGHRSNNITEFRHIACWFRLGGRPPPGLPSYNAFVLRNGGPQQFDRWQRAESFWVEPQWGTLRWAETQRLMSFEGADRLLKVKGYLGGYRKVVIGGWGLEPRDLPAYCFVDVRAGPQHFLNVEVSVTTGATREVERCENSSGPFLGMGD